MKYECENEMFNNIWGREYNVLNEISLIKMYYNKFEHK